MALRMNKCCCCNLRTGVSIYAVFYAFTSAVVCISEVMSYADKRHGTSDCIRHAYLASGIIGFLKALLLLWGTVKEHSKMILAYISIQGLLLVIASIGIIVLTVTEPLYAVLFVAIGMCSQIINRNTEITYWFLTFPSGFEAFLLFFVYSYYKELIEKTANVNVRFGSGVNHKV